MDKSKKEMLILILIVFFGLNYALFEYFFIPKNNILKVNKQRYEEKEVRVNYLKEQQENIGGLQSQIEDLNKQTAALDNKINTPELVTDFYNTCKKYNVKGENISFQVAEKTGEVFQPFLMNLSISGTNGAVRNFIKEIESSTNKKMNVKSVNLTEQAVAGSEMAAQIVLYQYINTNR